MRAFEHRIAHGSIAMRARMKYTGAERLLAAVVLAIAIWPLASAAHSMREVEAALKAAEPAAQVVDEAAPDLALEDARGKQMLFAAALAHGEHGVTRQSTRADSSFTGARRWAIGGAFAVLGLAAFAALERRRRRGRPTLPERS